MALNIPRKTIGSILGVVQSTSDKHLELAYRKIGAVNSTEAIHWAINAGLVPVLPVGRKLTIAEDTELHMLRSQFGASGLEPSFPVPIKRGPIPTSACVRLQLEPPGSVLTQHQSNIRID